VEENDADLRARSTQLQIHPTGPLWGRGSPPTGGAVLEIESHIGARYAAESRLCSAAGMRQERRSLRLAVQGLSCAAEAGGVVLRFRLGRGGFATAVLRELMTADTLPQEG